MGKQSWGQEIVALAKLCFGKNSKRIKSDYCLSHEIAFRGGGRGGSKSENQRKLSEKMPEQSLSHLQGRRTRLICQERQDQTIGIQNTGTICNVRAINELKTGTAAANWHYMM